MIPFEYKCALERLEKVVMDEAARAHEAAERDDAGAFERAAGRRDRALDGMKAISAECVNKLEEKQDEQGVKE